MGTLTLPSKSLFIIIDMTTQLDKKKAHKITGIFSNVWCWDRNVDFFVEEQRHLALSHPAEEYKEERKHVLHVDLVFEVGYHSIFSAHRFVNHINDVPLTDQEATWHNFVRILTLNPHTSGANLAQWVPYSDTPWMRIGDNKIFAENLSSIITALWKREKLEGIRKKYCRKINWDTFRFLIKEWFLSHPDFDDDVKNHIIKQLVKGEKKLANVIAIKDALLALRNRAISVRMISSHLKSKSPPVVIGEWTISNILRKDLNCSYKKPWVFSSAALKPDIERNRLWFRTIFKHMVLKGCRFIWIDEVSFNHWKLVPQIWVNPTLQNSVTGFKQGPVSTAICALTDDGYFFAKFWRGTNTAISFTAFLEELESVLHEFRDDHREED